MGGTAQLIGQGQTRGLCNDPSKELVENENSICVALVSIVHKLMWRKTENHSPRAQKSLAIQPKKPKLSNFLDEG